MNKGIVKFFNETKGYGFIKDEETGKEYFVHVTGLIDEINENGGIDGRRIQIIEADDKASTMEGTVIAQKFVTNIDNQVVSAGDQALVTMASGSLLRSYKKEMKEERVTNGKGEDSSVSGPLLARILKTYG